MGIMMSDGVCGSWTGLDGVPSLSNTVEIRVFIRKYHMVRKHLWIRNTSTYKRTQILWPTHVNFEYSYFCSWLRNISCTYAEFYGRYGTGVMPDMLCFPIGSTNVCTTKQVCTTTPTWALCPSPIVASCRPFVGLSLRLDRVALPSPSALLCVAKKA